jgi:release factor glutamine methyltransferase
MPIYEPQEDSYLLQTWVKEYAIGRVLDIGTGSGIQALTAAENKNVREVLAVDINEEAIHQLAQKTKLLKKITPLYSNLFEKIDGQFDVILFNPPYLPQDKGIEDPALYGGKKGWEISEQFFKDVSKFLVAKGKILFLFSSYTNKEKIEEIISKHLFQFKELERKKMALFEELYVYLIEKSDLLRELERKGIEQVEYLAKGKRGVVYSGIWKTHSNIKSHLASVKNLKVAIKIENSGSTATNRLENETKWLAKLNLQNIGPKLYFSGTNYLVMELVEGPRFGSWAKAASKEEVQTAILDVLNQAHILDKIGVNKEEMHHPYKHLLMRGNRPVLIDFERCKETENPGNVTQFLEFLARSQVLLKEKGISWKEGQLRELGKKYKLNYDFNCIKALFS